MFSPRLIKITAKFVVKSTYNSSFQLKRGMTDSRLSMKNLESQTFKNLTLARKNQILLKKKLTLVILLEA